MAKRSTASVMGGMTVHWRPPHVGVEHQHQAVGADLAFEGGRNQDVERQIPELCVVDALTATPCDEVPGFKATRRVTDGAVRDMMPG